MVVSRSRAPPFLLSYSLSCNAREVAGSISSSSTPPARCRLQWLELLHASSAHPVDLFGGACALGSGVEGCCMRPVSLSSMHKRGKGENRLLFRRLQSTDRCSSGQTPRQHMGDDRASELLARAGRHSKHGKGKGRLAPAAEPCPCVGQVPRQSSR